MVSEYCAILRLVNTQETFQYLSVHFFYSGKNASFTFCLRGTIKMYWWRHHISKSEYGDIISTVCEIMLSIFKIKN